MSYIKYTPEFVLKNLQKKPSSSRISFDYSASAGSPCYHYFDIAVSEPSELDHPFPASEYSFPRVLCTSVSPVLKCQVRHWGALTIDKVPLEKRIGRHREVMVLFSGMGGNAFFMRDVFEHVALHCKTDWWQDDQNVRKVFVFYKAMGNALEEQVHVFDRLFFVAFKADVGKGRGAEYTLRSKCRECGQCKECGLYSEVLDRFVAAGKRFDRSRASLIKLLAKSQGSPLHIVPNSQPFSNPFVRELWSDYAPPPQSPPIDVSGELRFSIIIVISLLKNEPPLG